MSILAVARIHDAVQQDGHWSGTPATFVKLLASLEAPWLSSCDHAVFEDSADCPVVANPLMEVSHSLLLRGLCHRDAYARLGEATLYMLLRSHKPRHVVITGPEPCDNTLTRLCELLTGAGKKVQIETRGRSFSVIPETAWVTLRPVPMRTGPATISEASFARANELISRVYRGADIEDLDKLVTRLGRKGPLPVTIVPGKADRWLYNYCIEAAAYRRWRVARPATTELVMA